MAHDGASGLTSHPVVSHEKWLAARTAFLVREKEFTRLRDQVSEERRQLPWEAVTKNYVFDGPTGKRTLAELFEGRSQLVVYHAMFDPPNASESTSWTKDAACHACSFWADNFNGIIVHLNHRDVTMVAVLKAPFDKLEAYKKRMGWTFKWVSSLGSDFNRDYQVSFTPEEMQKGEMYYNYTTTKFPVEEATGISVFYQEEEDEIFHTYSC